LDVPALDGNIRRVYARLFDIAEPADSPLGENILWKLAEDHLPKGQAGDYNQALMDLGATICLPKNPRCLICPLMKVCKARKNGTQENRPVMKPKKDVPQYVHAAGVIINNGQVLLAQRPSKGLLGGMWEFPNGRVDGDPARSLAKALKTGYNLKVRAEPRQNARAERRDSVRLSRSRSEENLGVFQHAYTHFKVTVHAFRCELLSSPDNGNLKWVTLKELDDYPMGKIDRQIAQKAQELHLT
jgi:A/G-specific adenine glycosylase